MVEKIIENGSDKIRRIALNQLNLAQHIRFNRDLFSGIFAPDQKGMRGGKDSYSYERIRKVYDASHGEELPGRLVRDETDGPTGDRSVDEAFDGAGHTWNFYNEAYGRNSIDDYGMIINQTVHFGTDYNNAFWNGEQMVYGDGDGELFDSFTTDLDIIAHELTHGVVQYEAGLRYYFQSGALNESFADVFGTLVKQRALNQDVNGADWLVGDNVLVGKFALRSLKAPGTAYLDHPIIGTDPQPATMDDYAELSRWQDNGGVHINSGIPNHAFYIAAKEIGGNAWEKTGLIWYKALTEKLRSSANFAKAASATIRSAREEFGKTEEAAVTRAWREVKVI